MIGLYVAAAVLALLGIFAPLGATDHIRQGDTFKAWFTIGLTGAMWWGFTAIVSVIWHG